MFLDHLKYRCTIFRPSSPLALPANLLEQAILGQRQLTLRAVNLGLSESKAHTVAKAKQPCEPKRQNERPVGWIFTLEMTSLPSTWKKTEKMWSQERENGKEAVSF